MININFNTDDGRLNPCLSRRPFFKLKFLKKILFFGGFLTRYFKIHESEGLDKSEG